MADGSRVIFNCPDCDSPGSYNIALIGKLVRCSACGSRFNLLEEDEGPEPWTKSKTFAAIVAALWIASTCLMALMMLTSSQEMPGSPIVGLIVGSLTFTAMELAYFAPSIVAFFRSHRNALPIFILNLLLGWTCGLWVICLVWSFTADVSQGSD